MAISISYPIHEHFLYQPETPIFAQGSKAQRLIYWWRVDIGYNRQMRREIINCIHLFFLDKMFPPEIRMICLKLGLSAAIHYILAYICSHRNKDSAFLRKKYMSA